MLSTDLGCLISKISVWDWSAILSNLTAAFIGGLCTLGGAILAINKQAKISNVVHERNKREELIGFLETIKEETSVIKKRYEETFGKCLKDLAPEEPVLWLYPIDEDYFSVYHANVNKITHVRNAMIRNQIVRTYTLCKGLIDTIKLNNRLFEKYYEIESHKELNPSDVIRQHANQAYSHLKNFRQELDVMDSLVRENISLLVQQISDELKRMENSHV